MNLMLYYLMTLIVAIRVTWTGGPLDDNGGIVLVVIALVFLWRHGQAQWRGRRDEDAASNLGELFANIVGWFFLLLELSNQVQ